MIQALGFICLKVGPDPNKEVLAKEKYVTAATLARCINSVGGRRLFHLPTHYHYAKSIVIIKSEEPDSGS